MTNQDFIRAVCAEPDDDAPRLVYADWLEEGGDSDRAAFIRAQVRLAHFNWRALPPGVESYPGERVEVQRLSDDLWHRHHQAWLGELPQSLRRVAKYHRGFVEELSGAPGHLLKVSARAWAGHPIRRLAVDGDSGELASVLALPQIGRIRQLWLSRRESENDLATFAEADTLSGVRMLSVTSGKGDPTFAALARCPSLRGLADLFIYAGLDNITPDGFFALTDSENAAGLVALRLEMIHLKEHNALVIARSPRLAGLKVLRIVGRIGDEGARALCDSPYLRALECLELHFFNSVSASAQAALYERFGAAFVPKSAKDAKGR